MNEITNMNPALVAVGELMVGDSMMVAMSLIPIILIVLLTISIVRSLMGGQGVSLDYGLVIRGLMLFFVAMFYAEWVSMLSYTASVIIDAFERPEGFLESLEEMAAVGLLGEDGKQDPTLLNQILKGLRNLPVMIMVWIQEGLTLIVRLGVEMLRSYLLTFLYIVGPLAISVSLLPGFQATVKMWLKAFIGAQFWSLTLTILDNLIYAYNLAYLADASSGAGGYLHALTANLVIIFMYLISPALTNYYINAVAASQFWGRVGALAGSTFLFGPRLLGGRLLKGKKSSIKISKK